MNSKFVIVLFAVSCACAIVSGLPAAYNDSDEEPTQSLRAFCVLPMETGICRARMPRWGYDAKLGSCVSFFYGGCRGNGNNFDTEEECVKTCKGV